MNGHPPRSSDGLEETSHPVQMNLENVPNGYRLSREDRASIVGFVRKLLDDNLIDSFQLHEVTEDFDYQKRNLLSPSTQ